jgi:multiple antibiotic resistance protein
VILTNPAAVALNELSQAPIVRFSLLALSSIFFLVDPFAAIPSFLAITESADPARRKRMARKGALTCFIVLTTFAVAGQLIFKMFGITLPAFEIAGGLILLLIGLDMLEARRSPTQETTGDAEEAAAKEDAGIVPLGIPMLAGPGAISSVMVLVGSGTGRWALSLAPLRLQPWSATEFLPAPAASARSWAKPEFVFLYALWAYCWSPSPCSTSSTVSPISA